LQSDTIFLDFRSPVDRFCSFANQIHRGETLSSTNGDRWIIVVDEYPER